MRLLSILLTLRLDEVSPGHVSNPAEEESVKDKTQPTRTLTRNGPRLISERKLQANRENAKKSTGPRTARGKRFSRLSAVTHGFFAKDLFPDLA
jgi:hypothetical protein